MNHINIAAPLLLPAAGGGTGTGEGAGAETQAK